MRHIFLLLAFSAVFFSCSHKAEHVERAFYYWKNNEYELTGGERQLLDALKIRKMYLKCFEVEYNDVMGGIPIAKSRMHEPYYYDDEKRHDSINVIPAVYIKNEVFLKSSRQELDTLAANVDFLAVKYIKIYKKGIKVKELQIDCDWTLKSRDNYFYFLNKLKKISGKQISCTLRLYPYKYPDKMGVPPVDKATLMCYNLINPLASKNQNSILDVDELSKYLNKRRKYKLHLDIALPVFSWAQLYQNNRFKAIIYPEDILNDKSFKRLKPFWYEVNKDTVIDDFYLREGDVVKFETIKDKNISDAIAIIKKNIVFTDTTTITLFHLDDKQLKKYSYETLSGFYSAFSE